MGNIQRINEHIYRLTLPYKDIFTTVYVVQTDSGALLFDAASFDEDVENYIVPIFDALGITADMLKYVFISHNHRDHAGALKVLMQKFPNARIVSNSPQLKEAYSAYNVVMPEDGDVIMDVLKVITVPGHTQDSIALYDTRTKTVISGDCLQLYGIFGSGKWGSNISLVNEHIEAIAKLKAMDIESIYTAHDYHPYGHCYLGKTAVANALDACVQPLYEIKDLILNHPNATDAELCAMFNAADKPTLGDHVITAVRKDLC